MKIQAPTLVSMVSKFSMLVLRIRIRIRIEYEYVNLLGLRFDYECVTVASLKQVKEAKSKDFYLVEHWFRGSM